MNTHIEIGLAFILFLPTFCIIGWLYCVLPRGSRGTKARKINLAVLLLAAAFSIAAMRWGFHAAMGVGGALWKHLLATLLAYAAFLSVLGCGWMVRAWTRRGVETRNGNSSRHSVSIG